jgi:hypothetical protein
MIAETKVAERAGLEQTLERRITERTWGRIRRLQVAVEEERVLIQGFTESYYAKQLAIQGALRPRRLRSSSARPATASGPG